MTSAKARAIARDGFTLMEVLVVMAILVVVAGVGGVVYMRYLDEAKEKTAKLGVQNIEQAVQAYKVNQGDYPPNLSPLIQAMDGKPAALEQSVLIDPWGREYVYEPDNRHTQTGKPRIYSQGPNNGVAQIANWYP